MLFQKLNRKRLKWRYELKRIMTTLRKTCSEGQPPVHRGCFMDCPRGQVSMRTRFLQKTLRRSPCAAHKVEQQKLERHLRASLSHRFRTILADRAAVGPQLTAFHESAPRLMYECPISLLDAMAGSWAYRARANAGKEFLTPRFRFAAIFLSAFCLRPIDLLHIGSYFLQRVPNAAAHL